MDRYKLIEKEKPAQKLFKVIIVADENDGDYITTIETYKEEEFEEGVVDDLILLKSKCSGNYELEKIYRLVGELYDRYLYISIPHGENGCCHSLESLEITCTDTNGKVYDVELVCQESEED